MQLARELLADFREVEHNFRQLDRKVREKHRAMGGRQGRAARRDHGRARCDRRLRPGPQLPRLLGLPHVQPPAGGTDRAAGSVLALPRGGRDLKPEPRTRRVHHDWLEAGEHTQRTVAQLSQQLRRFLDDRAFLENRRILDLLHGVESKALALRESPPTANPDGDRHYGCGHRVAVGAAAVYAQLEAAPRRSATRCRRGRHRHRSIVRPDRRGQDAPAQPLQRALRRLPQITLRDLLDVDPLHQGLAELVAYLELAHAGPGSDALDGIRALVDEAVEESIRWQASNAAGEAVTREAHLPRVIFTR